jgi:hypothetical protein
VRSTVEKYSGFIAFLPSKSKDVMLTSYQMQALRTVGLSGLADSAQLGVATDVKNRLGVRSQWIGRECATAGGMFHHPARQGHPRAVPRRNRLFSWSSLPRIICNLGGPLPEAASLTFTIMTLINAAEISQFCMSPNRYAHN